MNGAGKSRFVGWILAVAPAVVLLGLSGCRPGPDVGPDPIDIAAVGDTSGYRVLEETGLESDPLDSVREVLEGHDLFVFNYEGVILNEAPADGVCRTYETQSTFYTTTPIADYLQPARVNIATLANNHVLDCGPRGLNTTIAELDMRGIHVVGAGMNAAEACEPLLIDHAGHELAFVAYLAMSSHDFCAAEDRAGAACYAECGGGELISKLERRGRTVIASLHLHLERGWTTSAPESHIDLAQEVMQHGATAVIGHGPHMLQGVMAEAGSVALLSLGNFLFHTDYVMPREAHESVIARLQPGTDPMAVSFIPVELSRTGLPYLPPEHAGLTILYDLQYLSERFDTAIEVIRDQVIARLSND